MTVEQIIHELILARAQLVHARSTVRYLRERPWNMLTQEQRERFVSEARQSVEPLLLTVKP